MFCGEFLGMKEFIATQGWVYFRLRNLQKTFIFDANNFEFAKNSFLPLKSCRFWTFGSLWKLCEIKGGSDFASENVKILQFRCNNFESRTDCRFRTFESLRNWMNSKGVWFRFKKLPKILHFWYTWNFVLANRCFPPLKLCLCCGVMKVFENCVNWWKCLFSAKK